MSNPLVARTRELAELVVAVGGAGAVVAGPTGVGKTALAAAVGRHVEASGDRVERLVATTASRPLSFGALGPLLPDDATVLHPALVPGAIRRRQRELGAVGPPLFIVDDAHLLDDHSAATLLGLVSTGAVRLLVTITTGEPAPDAVVALWKDGLVVRHEVGPFDRGATQLFLSAVLDGEVAAGTASLLWHHTRGNALYLRELVLHARARGGVVDEEGIWIWRGDLGAPPRLADLLDRRFDGLTSAGLDALGALVLGEPLPIGVIEDVATATGVSELEARHIVEPTDHDGVVWYRFAHPMLGAAAAHQLSTTRRRRIADALVAAPGQENDIVRRAVLQLEVTTTPDLDVLRAGAAAVFLTEPELARRLAARALPHDPTPQSALLLADAHAELGQLDAVRRAQSLALEKVRSPDDLLHVRLNHISVTAFSDRRPDVALELLTEAASELPARFRSEIDSMAAQVTVFSARPRDALELAETVLGGSPTRAGALRASSVRVLALAMVDRSVEAVDAGGRLLHDVAAGPASPYAQGIAHLAIQVARFIYWADQDAPATDPSGRWPVPPVGDRWRSTDAVSHPLFDGARRLFQGHVASAVPLLREALAQQQVGEGLLRSEAVAMLAVALAATGKGDDADRLLRRTPPDRVAVYAGLQPWARSVVEALAGRPSCIELAFEAYREARSAGSPVSAIAYLAAAARYGAAVQAATELQRCGYHVESPISAARQAGIVARASGDGATLLAAAERNAEIGVLGDALTLADLAVAALGGDRTGAGARATSLVAEVRHRLLGAGATAPLTLTRRELEVANLAATGMSDADVASTLLISVRTVESHLASTYRKLGIRSRQGLRTALQPD